ncbi:hypothetical protein [uncultured Neglectibacter sp.]|uniref:hypothetical protein n=1 Tax=uncultured Neglectibacter sp. TaxID=1924108 RepID=UPI0034DE9CA6
MEAQAGILWRIEFAFSPKFSAFAQGDFCPLSCAAVRDFLFLLERGFAPFQTPRKKLPLGGFPAARGIPHQKGSGLRLFPIIVGVWGSGAPPCNNNRVAIITENPCGMQYRSFPSGKSTGLLPSRFILRNRAPGIGTHQNAQQEALWKRKTRATVQKPSSEKGSGRRTKRRTAQRKDTIAHCKCNLL